MKLTRERVAILALVVALVAAASSWAATAGTAGTDISVESSLPSGKRAELTMLPDSFTVSQGAAKKVAGVKLYKIVFGSPRFSDLGSLRIHLINTGDVGKVLNNPNAYIDVSVWYPDEAGSLTINVDGEEINVSPDGATGRLSRVIGATILTPSTPNVTTYYILASITTPGGIPPGQQQQLTELQFYCEVR